MTPQAALGGVEFHAKASLGLTGSIGDQVKVSAGISMEKVREAAKTLDASYRDLYRELKDVATQEELAALDTRKSELKGGES